MGQTVVLRAEAPERREREMLGWSVVARSFGAQLDASHVDPQQLREMITRADCDVRELQISDVDEVLALDAATAQDYPGSAATQHEPLNRSTAMCTASRRSFGAFSPVGDLVAVTFVDIDGTGAETDFTVVDRAWRRRGLGTAVKAASVLALLSEGVVRFRTGGSTENAAILAANNALGYARDEEWVTLEQSSSSRLDTNS